MFELFLKLVNVYCPLIEVAGFEDIHDTFSTFMYVYSMIIVVYIKSAFL
jgi:hypothetical protein